MATTPWMTSANIIEEVTRQISFPLSQNTFSQNDILKFANGEIASSILPKILQYHEEFFVVSSSLVLETNKSRYPIPNRAVGMKLRDVFYGDGQQVTPALPYGNLFEMTRINPDDKAWFGNTSNSNSVPYKYFIEGNSIVVVPAVTGSVTGVIVFYWFMRPNQLVLNDQAMIVNGFSKSITVTNSLIVPGDIITLTQYINATNNVMFKFTAVTGAPGPFEFQIGATSTLTSTSLTAAINAQNLPFSATNGGSSPTNKVKVLYAERQNSLTAGNPLAFSVQATLNLESADPIPSNITALTQIDLLQTLPGHKTLNYDILVPAGGVSGSTLTLIDLDVPPDMIVGDYVCDANECIIPQFPPELHQSIVSATCAKILQSIGDQAGLAMQQADMQAKDAKEPMLVDSRVDGAPLKILNRNGLLNNRRGRFGRGSI